MTAASAVGLTGLVHGCVSDLSDYRPQAPLTAVVCTPAAFAGLTSEERARVIDVLQSATRNGGVHLVETVGANHAGVTLDELRSSYLGWDVSVERGLGSDRTFLARKSVA